MRNDYTDYRTNGNTALGARRFRVVNKEYQSNNKRPVKTHVTAWEKEFFMVGVTVASIAWVALIIVVSMVALMIRGYNNRAVVPDVPSGYEKVYTTVEISKGSTLWDTAWEVIDEYNMESVYRTKDMVYEISRINSINNPDVIKAGQQIIVPYLRADESADE